MTEDNTAVVWGPGANDPKRVFGTTADLLELFGPDRVYDGAISEACYTGHCLGLALNGFKPIVHFQRIDFAFLAWDQIINNICKWSSMFGEDINYSITLRAVVGRGWGQGQQHSQNPISMLTSFPGMKIYTPTTPQQAYSCYKSTYNEKQPSFVLEHRWLQDYVGHLDTTRPHSDQTVYKKGKDITLVSYSYGIIECLRASKALSKIGVSCSIIGVNTFDEFTREKLQRTFDSPENSIVFDLHWKSSSPLINLLQIRETKKHRLIALPNSYTPTASTLVKDYYPTWEDIYMNACDILGVVPEKNFRKYFAKNIDQPLYDDLLIQEQF